MNDCKHLLFPDKRGIDGRLASAQTALMLQEETIRRNERERKAMADKISNLERAVSAGDSEKRQLNVGGAADQNRMNIYTCIINI